MRTLSELKRETEGLLIASSVDDAHLDARLLICEVLNLTAIDYVLENKRTIKPAEYSAIMDLVTLRKSRIPMSQIFGEKEFWSLNFKVTRDVLTPRPDSETLIEAALNEYPDRHEKLNILDMGTGSGCLLLALLSEYPSAQGIGIDISEKALNVALENVQSLKLSDRANFKCSNWFAELTEEQQFDIIIANPPYIGLDEKEALAPEVKDHEPATALFSGKDGLSDYRLISRDIYPFLKENGVIVLEIGHQQASNVKKIFTSAGFNSISVYKDLGSRDRCLMIKK